MNPHFGIFAEEEPTRYARTHRPWPRTVDRIEQAQRDAGRDVPFGFRTCRSGNPRRRWLLKIFEGRVCDVCWRRTLPFERCRCRRSEQELHTRRTRVASQM